LASFPLKSDVHGCWESGLPNLGGPRKVASVATLILLGLSSFVVVLPLTSAAHAQAGQTVPWVGYITEMTNITREDLGLTTHLTRLLNFSFIVSDTGEILGQGSG